MHHTIDVKELHFSYPDGRKALNGVNLYIAPGEKVALVGPNGAGKSTLMLHLNGILRGEGEIQVCDQPVTDDNLGLVRASVGLVFQDPGTALDPLMRVGPQVPQEPVPGELLPPPDPIDLPPCVIERFDLIEGLFEGEEEEGYTGFAAHIDYIFTPQQGSVCDDLHRPEMLAGGVPCTIAYEATATRAE